MYFLRWIIVFGFECFFKKRSFVENIFLRGRIVLFKDGFFRVIIVIFNLFNVKFCFKEVNIVIIKISFIYISLIV